LLLNLTWFIEFIWVFFVGDLFPTIPGLHLLQVVEDKTFPQSASGRH
jgi:hypothetical protein